MTAINGDLVGRSWEYTACSAAEKTSAGSKDSRESLLSDCEMSRYGRVLINDDLIVELR